MTPHPIVAFTMFSTPSKMVHPFGEQSLQESGLAWLEFGHLQAHTPEVNYRVLTLTRSRWPFDDKADCRALQCLIA